MASQCDRFIRGLANIKELQEQLNQKIADFQSVQDNASAKGAAIKLMEIYDLRKSIDKALGLKFDVYLESHPEFKDKVFDIKVTLGQYKRKKELIDEIAKVSNVPINISKMMNSEKFSILTEEINVNIVVIPLELLFDNNEENVFMIDEIIDQAKSIGLKLCPPEVGPQLLLQYPKQLSNFETVIYIGMKPINSDVFTLIWDFRSNHNYLVSWGSVLGDVYHRSSHLAFVLQ